MPLRTRIIRALDDEIPISPREFGPEARQTSVAIAKWRQSHPAEVLSESMVFDALREAIEITWGREAVANWAVALHRVARKIAEGEQGANA